MVLRKYGSLFTTFECYGFGFNGIKMSVGDIKLEEEHFSFDYKLRDILWGLTLFLGENNFLSELSSRDFSQTKLTFLYDEHQTRFINYVLLKRQTYPAIQ